MKKTILLALSIALFLYIVPNAYAAKEESIFSDIDSSQWFYGEIASSKKYQVINGYEDGSFKPNNKITHIEALKIAVLSTMTLGAYEGKAWDSKYIESAKLYGLEILNNEKNTPITRYEFFFYIYKLLTNKYEFEYTKTERIFADYNDNVTSFFYKTGLLLGVEENGKYLSLPNKSLTRAEAVTISNRVIAYVFNIHTRDFKVVASELPVTELEIRKAMLNAGINKSRKLQFYYPSGVNYAQLAKLFLDDFNDTRGEHYEYFSNVIECNAKAFGYKDKILLEIYFEIEIDNNDSEIDRFFESCRKINDYLWNSGTLNLNMTQKEIAKEIFKYICINYKYDTDVKYEGVEINQGNKMIDSGKGICMGYTTIFNQLCKLNGIHSIGVIDDVDGVGHIYSKAILDGKIYYIDATFGDPTPDKPGEYREKWFGLTKEEMINLNRNLGRDFIEKFDIEQY